MCVPIISLMFYTLEAQVVSSTYQNSTDGELPLLLRSNFFWHKSREANSFESLLSWNSSNGKWSSCLGMSLLCWLLRLGIRRVSGCEKCIIILPFHRWVFPCHLLDLLPLPLLLLIFFLRRSTGISLFSGELCKAWHQHNNKNTITRPSLQKPLGHFLLLLAGKMAPLRYAHPSAPPNLWRENPLLHPQQSIHPPLKKKGKPSIIACVKVQDLSTLAFSTIMMGYMSSFECMSPVQLPCRAWMRNTL